MDGEQQKLEFTGLWIDLASFSEKEFTPTDMILYRIISVLCEKKGYCWASNKYFAFLLHISIPTVVSSLNKQKRLGYITTSVSQKKGNFREIRVTEGEKIEARRKQNRSDFYAWFDSKNDQTSYLKSFKRVFKDLKDPLKNSLSNNIEDNIGDSKATSKDVAYGGLRPPITPPENSLQEEFLGGKEGSSLPEEGETSQQRKHHRPTRESFAADIEETDRRMAERARRPKRGERDLEVASEDAITILFLWNEQPNTTHHDPEGAVGRRALHILDRSILPDHKVEKVAEAIQRYSAAVAKFPERFGWMSKKLSLDGFLQVPQFLLKQWERQKGKDEQKPLSLFRQLYSPNGNGDVEAELETYKFIRHVYVEQILGIKKTKSHQLTWKQELDLLRTVPKFNKFVATGWLRTIEGGDPEETYLSAVLEALIGAFGKTGIRTGNFCSDYTWAEIVPKYVANGHGTQEEVDRAEKYINN